ncbi:hypothetical protein [Streptomyces sp. NPDC088775]|uniref:hypothetical protein n=1 Tax=Streptomyces sp. NPDC088775 TaxID=3365896 RepID=UPI0037FC5CCA
MNRLRRAGGYCAAVAISVTHTVLVLGAGIAAASYAWRHGYTLPYDSSANAALTGAVSAGLGVAYAAARLTDMWVDRAWFAVQGRTLADCPACGALVEPITEPVAHNGEKKPTEKELTQ